MTMSLNTKKATSSPPKKNPIFELPYADPSRCWYRLLSAKLQIYSMAAIRRIIGSNKTLPLAPPPSLLTFRRAIAFKLFVGGLSVYTTEKGLSDAFSNCGQVIEAKIVTDRVSERSKGFGFVTFASHDDAENAISQMNGKALNGRVVFVDYAKPSSRTGAMPIARGPPEPPEPTVDS